jgi:hypothetical protein
MVCIDLRKIGCLTKEDEYALAELIARASADPVKQELSLRACKDMNWSGEGLIIYELANVMQGRASRAQGCISSAEWLCGIFCSGHKLQRDHLLMLMSFVNTKQSVEDVLKDKYTGAQEQWSQAPTALRNLLNLLDKALVDHESVQVMVPFGTPRTPEGDLARLEELSLDELRPHIIIEWASE